MKSLFQQALDKRQNDETAEKIHRYLESLFEFDKDVTTFTVIAETNFDNRKEHLPSETKKIIYDSVIYHIHIQSKKVGRMIGTKGWILKILREVISLKFKVKTNFHLENV